jgi:NADPH:quinone reductase-like Zn-dependent oxidoreductase
MKAIVRKQYGGSDQLAIETVADPIANANEVLIRVRAFGINRAEIYMRRGVWGEVATISGIECVGEVVQDGSGRIKPGQTVAAIMGGMGRTRNGSYAELTCVPASNVVALDTDLAWPDLAAIPESYATAWGCLSENMQLRNGDTVLIRGGTSALGQAAINIAVHSEGVKVLATTRNPDHVALLQRLGCVDVLLEADGLSGLLREQYPRGVDSVLDIVGNTTLLDSLKMVKKGGYVCNAGFLGGRDPISFNPIAHLPSSVNLNFFGSFMFGSDTFPLSTVPLQEIVDKSAQGIYQNKPVKTFRFEDIGLAHDLMEADRAVGKIVVHL